MRPKGHQYFRPKMRDLILRQIERRLRSTLKIRRNLCLVFIGWSSPAKKHKKLDASRQIISKKNENPGFKSKSQNPRKISTTALSVTASTRLF